MSEERSEWYAQKLVRQADTTVLCHGRDVLLTRDKSTTGNVGLRFWVLVLGRSRDEQLLSF